MNYYERHLGDYARDTAHLSMVEHGAYTLLLDRYYATEKGIPADQVHRLARARSVDEREAVDVVLSEFFRLVDGLWVHNRVEEEIEKAAGRISAARENGRKGGRPKKEETQQKPNGFSLGSESETQQEPSEKLTNLHTPDTIKSEREMRASTPAGEAGIALRNAGCVGVNLSNPNFLKAIEEGVTADEFATAAEEAAERQIDPHGRFGYAVKVARSNHARVASPIEPNSRAGPSGSAPQSRTQLASQNIWDTVNAITQRNSELDSSGNRLGPGQAPITQLGRTSGA